MSGMRGAVLIVEDQAQQRELLGALVQSEGFTAVVCGDAVSARASYALHQPIAVLLDWVLPDAPGTQICREIRVNDASVTIIFISGRNDETSITRAFDAGADDYIAKPVRAGELVARLESHLQRSAALRGLTQAGSAQQPQRRFRFGSVEIDLDARQVSAGGTLVRLGRLEFKLLEYLVRNAGVAVSRDQILSWVYGIEADIGTDRVDLLVRRLR